VSEPTPDLTPKNGIGKHLWIKVEVEVLPDGNRLTFNSNVPPNLAIELLKDGIVGIAQDLVRKENQSLVKPVTGGPMPPLRRI